MQPVGSDAFTTIAGWQQLWRDVTLDGELYRWSKNFEFMKFLDSAVADDPDAGAGPGRVQRRGPSRARAARVADPRRLGSLRRPRYLPRVHRRLARRVHGREGSERPLAQRLVQRPQRHVSRRGAARGHAGHGLRQRAPDRAGPVRLLDAGRGGGGHRGHQRRLPERTHARPASSRAPISTRISCSRDCSRIAACRRQRPAAQGREPRHGPQESASRNHAAASADAESGRRRIRRHRRPAARRAPDVGRSARSQSRRPSRPCCSR